jgi:hypothetical protein
MTKQQLRWLSTCDRQTGSLSTYLARNCGYGDLLLAGYVVDRGPPSMPDLFITAKGLEAIASGGQPTRNP